MPTQAIKLTRSEEVAEGTMAFHFTRPSGFEFRAGQSVDEPVGPIYYVAGPAAMAALMRQMLASAGVDEDDIRTEGFSGH